MDIRIYSKKTCNGELSSGTASPGVIRNVLLGNRKKVGTDFVY